LNPLRSKLFNRSVLSILLLLPFSANYAQKKGEKESMEALKELIEERIEFMAQNQIEAQADFYNLFQNLEY
jgi:hypothetical protein